MLVDSVTVEYRRKDGSIAGAQARVIDFEDTDNNDWLAVNQFSVAESEPRPLLALTPTPSCCTSMPPWRRRSGG